MTDDSKPWLDAEPDETPLDVESLSVNELERFSKTSVRLILEQYSHCEVPAGCGGVVLRWVNPDSPVPFGCCVHGAAYCNEFFVDGVRHRSSQVMLTRGRHVLVLALTRRGDSLPPAPFMVVAGTDFGSVSRTGQSLPQHTVSSRADGRWHVATAAPSESALTALSPDLAVWSIPTCVPRPPRPEGYVGYYDECVKHDAEAFVFPSGLSTLWVRTVVEIDLPAQEG